MTTEPMSINDSETSEETTGADDASSSAGGDASLWESRFKGLQSKFEATQTQLKAEAEAKAKALADLEAIRTGKVSSEQAAQAQVDAIKAELETERKQRRVDSLKSKFPEAFSELGDDIASVMDETRLASVEARLAGGESPEGGTPRKHNESRTQSGTKRPAEESAADIEARLLSMPVPWNT